jgi:hypothetical protein
MAWALCLVLVVVPATLRGSGPVTREEAVQRAKESLAKETGLDPAEIRVRRTESVEWPDRSLGCPRDGEVYATLTTPGYRISLQVARTLYTVHVGGGRAVVCGKPLGPSQGPRDGARRPERVPEEHDVPVKGEVPERILDAVLNDLARRTNADRESFEIVRAEETVWNDGALGCPRPGVEYLPAPVRGYRVVLRHGDHDYDYRAVRPDFFVLCERPRVGPPSPPGPGAHRQD